MSFLFGRAKTSDDQRSADLLHDALIAVVRQPAFYLHAGVPDTFMGRFELLVLVASPVLRRFRASGARAEPVAQKLVDTLFRRLDIAMRELGVSDVAVPKRMKRLAEAFGGRSAAYDKPLATGDRAQLAEAISRNVLDGTGSGHDLADFIGEADARLQTAALDDLLQGIVAYPQPDAFLTRTAAGT